MVRLELSCLRVGIHDVGRVPGDVVILGFFPEQPRRATIC